MRQRLRDMQDTLAKMHALLTAMQKRSAASKSESQVTKDNVAMWQLMVDHLDKTFEELRAASVAREDLEARRAAMYEQAARRAAAEAQAARGSEAGKVNPEQGTPSAPAGTQGSAPAAVPPPER